MEHDNEQNIVKQEYRSSHRRYSVKKVFLEILQNSQENTCVLVLLWILRNFWEHLQTTASGSTWTYITMKYICQHLNDTAVKQKSIS